MLGSRETLCARLLFAGVAVLCEYIFQELLQWLRECSLLPQPQ